MRTAHFTRSMLVTTFRRVVIAVLLAGFGLTICIPSIAEAGRKKFYLTQDDTFDGSQALTACDKGFHMASLFEIHDPSNLQYVTKRGLTLADSGSGPPTGSAGWIWTGQPTSDSSLIGAGNCFVWTSNSGTPSHGTHVKLQPMWTASATAISPWEAGNLECNNTLRVWCVQH